MEHATPWGKAGNHARANLVCFNTGLVLTTGTLSKVPARSWTVETSLPLSELVYNTSSASPPRVWGLWRINFSRVEWHVQVVDGKYQKAPGPEDNWVGTFSSENTCRFDAFILVHESFNTPFRFEMCVVNSRTAELAQMPRAKLQPTNRQTDQSINQPT
jgi:hypothetical protein